MAKRGPIRHYLEPLSMPGLIAGLVMAHAAHFFRHTGSHWFVAGLLGSVFGWAVVQVPRWLYARLRNRPARIEIQVTREELDILTSAIDTTVGRRINEPGDSEGRPSVAVEG